MLMMQSNEKKGPGALFSAYIGQYMTLFVDSGTHFSEDPSSWEPKLIWGKLICLNARVAFQVSSQSS